ncbi:MAG: (Fe-S)-binding protein [Candidatus Electryonea clarkiae]|nr:(Fe-S)-binding protein [Candidatus Electryonea clarkiae]MDP8286024.1 (Fe-S)-binding protein [Candidatus Electryonea clarkiae]
MIKNTELEKFRDDLNKCVTCGICQPVCPSYRLSERELMSPRGRIILLRRLIDGDISPAEISPDAFDYCTLCYACQTACPAGVKTDLLFITARKTLADANGTDSNKSRIFSYLRKPKKLDTLVRLGALAQKTLGKKIVNNLSGGYKVPELQNKPLLTDLPEEIIPEEGYELTVGLFLGCISNYVNPESALACIEVLKNLGVRIVIPREQVCCGAPAFNNGDFDTARYLAKQNLELFSDPGIDFLLSPDATCGGAFQHEIPGLVSDDVNTASLANEISRKTIDFSTFILENTQPDFINKQELPIEVTLHHSCHTINTSGKHNNVRKLIELLPGVTIVDMEDSGLCCGFGGSFSLLYPEDSRDWTAKKIEDIKSVGVPVVIVPSPGCIMQFKSEFATQGINHIKVLHPAELIATRCGWDY